MAKPKLFITTDKAGESRWKIVRGQNTANPGEGYVGGRDKALRALAALVESLQMAPGEQIPINGMPGYSLWRDWSGGKVRVVRPKKGKAPA